MSESAAAVPEMDKIQEIRINTIPEAKEHLFFHQEYYPELGRNRTLYVYRGIPDISFKLITSLQRICKDQKNKLEEVVLNNFAKYAGLESPMVNESVWHKMIIGQHHGLPTRLLDWSRSPLMALHFAMTEGNMDMMDQRDCVLWQLDIEKLNEKLPPEYQKEIDKAKQKVFTVEMLQDVCESLQQYDADMKKDSMVMLEPPTIDMRIANQYSYFSIVPNQVNCVEDILEKCPEAVTKYIIDKNLRWQIRDMLDQANINERIVYPGLDGIATWLGRYYFVRDITRLKIKSMSLADLEADVLVNPSNTDLANKKTGVNNAIFYRAGKAELAEECSKAAPAKTGDIVATGAYNLKADKIYHVVGRQWDPNDADGSTAFLADLYRRILQKVKEDELHSIGFPLLSAGYQGCPDEKAWEIGLTECRNFQKANPGYALDITFCVIAADVHAQGESVLRKLEGKTDEIGDEHLYIGNSRKRRK